MAESKAHMDLVEIILEHVEGIVPCHLQSIIQCDSPTTSRPTKVIGGFIPDLYFWNNDKLIIGEAKTIKDFDNKHSKAQIESYYLECMGFYGEATLVMCVPWQLVSSVKNHMRILRKKYGGSFGITIINELGWKVEL